MASKINNGPEYRRFLNEAGVRRISGLAIMKNPLTIGTWNVRSLLKAGKAHNVIQEMKRTGIQILGLSEVRWPGTGKIEIDDHVIYFSGGENNYPQQYGVAFIIQKNIDKSIENFTPHSERIALIQLKSKNTTINLVQVHAPTADKEQNEIEEFYDGISTITKCLKKHHVNVILGDFNAKIGKGKVTDIIGEYGLGIRNDRGDRLIQFCQEEEYVISNTWFKLPHRRIYTWKSPQENELTIVRNQIDFVLINRRFKSSIQSAKTYPGMDIGSDHTPVVIKLRHKLKTISRTKPKEYNIEALCNKEIKEKVTIKLNEELKKTLTVGERGIEDTWQTIKNTIVEVQRGELKYKEGKKRKKWMTEDILELMEERRKHKNNKQLYKEIQRTIDTKIKEAKEDWINEMCDEIEELDNKHDTFNLHKKLKETSYNNKKRNIPILTDNKGRIIIGKNEQMQIWEEFIEKSFADNRPDLQQTWTGTMEGPLILETEVEHAIQSAKNRKACGPDKIEMEILKLLDDGGVELLTRLFNNIYENGEIPSEWLKSEFIAIPKKANSRKCDEFRLISLMSHALKIFLKIIQSRIYKKCELDISDSQFGFRKALGTREALFATQTLIQKCLDHQKKVYLCFIDYQKAFDRVQHGKLLGELQKLNLDGKDLRIIQNLYWNQEATLKYLDNRTKNIHIQRGVRQGCVMSPMLFNVYSERIFKEAVDEVQIGIKVNGKYINNIRYADDSVLMAESIEDLQNLLDRVNNASEEMGLTINTQKTKVMVISKTDENCHIYLNNTQLEQVHKFRYLGVALNDKWDPDVEIKSRIEQARNTYNKWKQIICNRKLSLDTRNRVIKCYVWSVLLYGAETWTLKLDTMRRLEAFEMWLYRRMLRISWTQHITNQAVLNTINRDQELLTTIKKRKTSYLGHIMRNDKYNLLRLIIEGKIEGRRGVGRRTMSWLRNIRAWTGMNVQQLLRAAQNREYFDVVIANLQ